MTIKDKVTGIFHTSSPTSPHTDQDPDSARSLTNTSSISPTSPTSGSSSSSDPSDYRLFVTAGPDYDKAKQRPLAVNTDQSIRVSDEVCLTFRVNGYTGLPTGSPRTHPYFSKDSAVTTDSNTPETEDETDHADRSKDTFSLAFAITPKDRDIPTKTLHFGIDTGHNPIRKFNLPKSLVKTCLGVLTGLVDPSLTCNIDADEPSITGPILAGSTMRSRVCGSKEEEQSNENSAPGRDMGEGAVGSGIRVRQEAGLPSTSDKRRKWFLNDSSSTTTTPTTATAPTPTSGTGTGSGTGSDSDNKTVSSRDFILQRNRRYEFDFGNGYIDFEGYKVKLPGFSVGVLKYIGKQSHKVRWVLRDVESGEVFFVVMCSLLTGAELEKALAAEEEERGRG